MPSPSSRHRFAVLVLRVAAGLAAAGAQTMVRTRPWLCLAGFALGAVLFVIAEWLVPAMPEPDAARPSPVPRGVWGLFLAGAGFCGAAGVLVYRFAAPSTTHPLWACGLVLLVAAALRSWWGTRSRQQPAPRVIAAVALLMILAGGLFATHLTSMPPEVHGDEAEEGNDALALLTNKPFNLFTVGWYELPMFHVFRQAVGVKVFGVNLVGLRSTSALLGAVSVLAVFAVGYEVWSFEVGLFAALLLVSARFFIHLSRTGLEYIDTPFVSIVVAWLAFRLWREHGVGTAICCGIVLGLGLQSYYASRLVPVLLALTWALWLVGSERALISTRIERFTVLVVAAVAPAEPMIGFFSHSWDALWGRTRGTSVFGADAFRHLSYGYHTQSLTEIIRIQAQKAFTLYNLTGDSSLQYGYGGGGLLEPVSAVLFVLGLAVICARPLRRAHLFLLLWILIPLIAGGVLTIDTPFFPRIGGTVPFVALLGGLALYRLVGSIRDALPASAGRIGAGAVAAGLLAAVFANNIDSYFIDYAPHHRHSAAVEISAWIRAHGAGKTTYMVGGAPGFFIKHGTIRFLAYGYSTADIVDFDTFVQGHPLNPKTSVFIIMPQGHDLVPKLEAAVGPLDIEEYRNIRNDVGFYGAIPRAAQAGS
jgi:hypothetical protein